MNMNRKKKYIIGGTAIAVAVASCSVGAYNRREAAVYNYNSEYMSGTETENEGAVCMADTEATDTDVLVSQLSEGINIEEKDVYKDETVYVFADASGNTNKILVNEHLKNSDGKAELTDKTDLKDIVNLKGYEEFTRNGDTITWKTEGNDIYYQGTSDKELPVQVKTTYYLDGKEILPNELAGKSGKVRIRFDYTNNTDVIKNINNRDEHIKIPFVTVTGMVLGDSFTNITVENGKTMQEGNSNIIIGYAAPGLAESLDVNDADFSDEISIPEYFEVSADVTDFALDMTVTLVMNGSELNMAGGFDFDNLDSVVDSLTDAGTQLVDGSGELADGVGTLLDRMGEFNSGVGTLQTGIDTLSNGSASLASGVATINTSAQGINSGIAALDTALNTPMTDEEKQAVANSAASAVAAQFAEGTETYNYIYGQAAASFNATMTSEDTVNAIYNGLYANLHDSLYYAAVANAFEAAGGTVSKEDIIAAQGEAIEAGIQQQLYALASGIASNIGAQGQAAVGQSVVAACTDSASQAAGQAAVTGAEGTKTQIASQIEAVQENGYSLVSGSAALAAGASSLAEKIPTLTDGISSLLSGAGILSDGSSQLAAGVSQLSEGATALNDGIVQFNDEAIQSIVRAYNGDIKSLASRIQAVIEASTEYDTYTMLSEGDAGTTKFIIKTEGISASE